ncbi:hypothetical protein Syun_002323 [Stephania yunnanensis]|uniref:Uncharacterized protein n=1 Tax=Stephania yunnanensis TaxID=152371 RepID=A0AAP0Q7X7_9MAGN
MGRPMEKTKRRSLHFRQDAYTQAFEAHRRYVLKHVSAKYCLWDHFKELDQMELIKSMNLARFTAEMLSSFSLSLGVLKTIELSEYRLFTPKRLLHFRMLFEAIFEHPDSTVWNIFTRIAVTPEFETLRDDILFFVEQYVVNTSKAAMAEKFKIAKKALNNAAGVLM